MHRAASNAPRLFDWADAWRDLRLPVPEAAVQAQLLRRWAEPHRKYHTLQHLAECLALVDRDSTPAYAARFDVPARANLARAIAGLA